MTDTPAPTESTDAARDDSTDTESADTSPDTPDGPARPGVVARLRRLGLEVWLPLTVGVVTTLLLYRNGLGSLRSHVFGFPGDSELFLWSFGWTPHAIADGQFPLLSDAVFSTTGGINLAHNTFAPFAAVLMWPITAAFGPNLSYNLYVIAAPTLDLLAAYYLLRFKLARVPATVGAFLFAFSPGIVLAADGHPQLSHIWALLFGIGLMSHAVFTDDRRLRRRRAVGGGVMLGLQLYMGTEMLAMGMVVFGLAVGLLVVIDERFRTELHDRLRVLVEAVATSGVTAAILGLPFFVTFLLGPEKYFGLHQVPDINVADAANLVVPTPATLFEGPTGRLIVKNLPWLAGERDAYLGILLLVLLAYVTLRKWRVLNSFFRLAVVASWLGIVLSLGSELQVWGKTTFITLPWAVLVKLPILKSILPTRIAIFTALAVGAVVGWVLDRQSRELITPVWRAVAVVGVVMCLPGAQLRSFPAPTESEAEAIAEYCGPDARVIAVPKGYQHHAMYLQARSGFAFDLVRGFGFRESSPEFGPTLAIDDESGVAPDAAGQARARAELADIGANCVVVLNTDRALWTTPADVDRLEAMLGEPCHEIGESCVWRVPSDGG